MGLAPTMLLSPNDMVDARPLSWSSAYRRGFGHAAMRIASERRRQGIQKLNSQGGRECCQAFAWLEFPLCHPDASGIFGRGWRSSWSIWAIQSNR